MRCIATSRDVATKSSCGLLAVLNFTRPSQSQPFPLSNDVGQVQSFTTPSYSEADVNAAGFGLDFGGRTSTDTRSEVGARIDRPTMVGGVPFNVRGRIAWAHDWVSDQSLFATFQALPSASFVVNGVRPAKDSAIVSVGPELRMTSALTLAAKFDGEFAGSAQTYAGTGTLRYEW